MKKKFEFEAIRYDKKGGGNSQGKEDGHRMKTPPPSTKKHRTSEG